MAPPANPTKIITDRFEPLKKYPRIRKQTQLARIRHTSPMQLSLQTSLASGRAHLPCRAALPRLMHPQARSRAQARRRMRVCNYLEKVEEQAPPAEDDASFTAPALPAVQAPTIDAQGFLAAERHGPVPLEVARAIAEAGQEAGCFQLVNHGVSLQLLADMKAAQRDFFSLPQETKLKVGGGGRRWVEGRGA